MKRAVNLEPKQNSQERDRSKGKEIKKINIRKDSLQAFKQIAAQQKADKNTSSPKPVLNTRVN